MSDNDDIVEIDFEVGHSSIIRSKPTNNYTPPRTHDWKIYLRSADLNGDLNCLIKRCVFYLHSDFENSVRELKSTPFAIQETGYAGFHLPIDIYFKTKMEPKKFRIEYDLDLHRNIDGQPYRQKQSYLRKYRCTFYNPDSEFRQKILAAGGQVVSSGSYDSDTDKAQTLSPKKINRHSPQQKRPISPAPSTNGTKNKKVKLDQSTINSTKQIQPVVQNENINKTTVKISNNKLVSHKSSSSIGDKTSNVSLKNESNKTLPIKSNSENSSSMKSHPTTKLVKSQSTTDFKQSNLPINRNSIKKEANLSSSKTKSQGNSENSVEKTKKTSSNTESTTNLKENVSNNNNNKKKASSSLLPSNSNTKSNLTLNSADSIKKIPKKPVSSVEQEKSNNSLISNRNSVTANDKNQSSVHKTQVAVKQNRLSSTTNPNSMKMNDTSKKMNNIQEKSKTKSSDSIRNEKSKQKKNDQIISPKIQESLPQSKRKTTNNTKERNRTPSVNDVKYEDQSSIENSLLRSEMDVDESNNYRYIQNLDKSISSQEEINLQPIKLTIKNKSYSELSDTTESNLSTDDEAEEDDLPTSLTNDDSRYKLIYIYKRFQAKSANDLIIFVQFFKRHHLIDISSLPMTKTNKTEMFTYDLLSLSPSHIAELASDLGYVTTSNQSST